MNERSLLNRLIIKDFQLVGFAFFLVDINLYNCVCVCWVLLLL